MKYILTTAILIATAFIAQADEKTITEKARATAGTVVEKTKEVARDTREAVGGAAHQAGKATRAAWAKTKAFVSDDLPVYREGANETLAGLSREIAEVKAQTPRPAPAYFNTRVLALDQQHEFLAKRLAQLSPEQLRDRASGPRHDFDRCVGDLEQAIDQAKDGAGTLAKTAVK